MEKSIGERRVRTDFNVAEGATKNHIAILKDKGAEFINLCEKLRANDTDGEVHRLIALAQTKAEEATMYAVKAATA